MDYRRFYQPGARYFFTVVTDGRQPLLIDHIERLRDAFRVGMSRQPFAVESIVVLPDHLHTIWRLPEGDADLSTRWMIIKRKFSAGFAAGQISPSLRAKREKGIWQRRFWEHYLRDEADWQRHVDYIHYNPVKHGYVAKAGDWPYSSRLTENPHFSESTVDFPGQIGCEFQGRQAGQSRWLGDWLV